MTDPTPTLRALAETTALNFWAGATPRNIETLMTFAEQVQALQRETDAQAWQEMFDWLDHFVSGEPMANGRYAHQVMCSGDSSKPSGTPNSGCCCNQRLKKALVAINAHASLVQEMEKAIEGLRPKPREYDERDGASMRALADFTDRFYNKALDDVLALLRRSPAPEPQGGET